MPEQNKITHLTKEEIEELVKTCAQIGANAYKEQEAEAQRRIAKNNDPARRMKKKLLGYRRAKKSLKEEQQFTPLDQREYRYAFIEDLMGDPTKNCDRTERMLMVEEEKRRQAYFEICQIDRALDLYKQECQESGNQEDIRRYRTLVRFYISDKASTVTEISELENVSEKTVYRDLRIACEILCQYAVGM